MALMPPKSKKPAFLGALGAMAALLLLAAWVTTHGRPADARLAPRVAVDRAPEACSGPADESGPAPAQHACRFWGLVGSGYPSRMIQTQLRDGPGTTLRLLGASNRDGWGIGSFLNNSTPPRLLGPLIRRGRPHADDPTDPEFDTAVTELAQLAPKAALGHVRAASSGHYGLPNPHPFQHEGVIFAHNGDVPTDLLVTLLTGDNPNYLAEHPPSYINGYIDSELYFLFLLKVRHQHPEQTRAEALVTAVRRLSQMTPYSRLNFVMTAGDTLYAMRCSMWDSYDPVCYYPSTVSTHATPGPSNYWVVASQPLGPEAQNWTSIPAATLGVFVPRSAPLFLPLANAQPLGRELSDQSGLTVAAALPNPTSDGVTIPLQVPSAGAAVSFWVCDVQGARVYEAAPTPFAGGAHELRWDGRDHHGRAVPAGSYFAIIRGGGRDWKQRILMVR